MLKKSLVIFVMMLSFALFIIDALNLYGESTNIRLEAGMTTGDSRGIVANMALIVNTADPIYVSSIQFTRSFPGESGRAILEIVNLADTSYNMKIVPQRTKYLNGEIVIENVGKVIFEPIYVTLDPGLNKINLTYYVPEYVAPGIYEIILTLYRGFDESYNIGEIHLIINLGDPVFINKIMFPRLYPGESAAISMEVENLASVPYELELTLKRVYGPFSGDASEYLEFNSTHRLVALGGSSHTLSIPFHLRSDAPVGTYTLIVELRRR